MSQADIELFIPAPAGGSFDAPVWLPKWNEFIVTYYPKGDDPRRRQLYRMDRNGSGFRRLRLPGRRGCQAVWNGNGAALGDGRVAYAQQCFGGEDFSRATRLMAYHPETQSAEQLVPYGLSFVAAIFDYSPDSVGVLNDHNGLEERLHWLHPDGLDAIDLPLERAGYPSWSPDGRCFALDGVPEGEDGLGVDKLDLPRELYLVSFDGKTLRPILRGFTSAGASAWSPDGRWLALPLAPSDAPEGLWLVEAASGKAHLLLAGPQFGGTEWLSNDALAIAVGIDASYRAPETEDVGMYVARIPELTELSTESKSACT